MKGIEKIKKKIMADASKEASSARAAARKEAKGLQQKHKTQHDEYKEHFNERTKALVASLQQKSLAQARLDVKKSILQKREEIIDENIATVVDKLDHGSKNYERFLKSMIDANLAHLSGNITVHCSKDDVSLAKQLLADKATVKEADLTGGLVFEDASGKRVDASLSAVLEAKKDTIRQEVAALLQ
ncbi:MAG: V-type ATP synthase subunit E [Candidatus Woesearchaeota archaeon]|nr:V-type ATP synthase subunit E [Candidatus Woesearchaeota archaeon]